MSNLITTQINQLATRFDLPQSEELYNVLRATAFKGDVTDAQLSALMIVASQYGLNPWTKEIYAFPDKGGIVPVVGVDGWSRIINSNPQFDGMDFEQDADSCTCIIYRKDRAHPIKVTEWMAECKRNGVGPWQSHPYRMLRHKAMIQCARIAFGFGGIFDQDEAERIIEADAPKKVNPDTGEITSILFDVVAALDAVEDCQTLDDLSATWKAEGAKAVAAKDNAGHAALKSAVKEKKAALESVTTVEMAA
jgi:phage recombination protein Bet